MKRPALTPTGFPGLRLAIEPEYLLAVAEGPLRVVTTAPYGAGNTSARAFLSIPATPGIECAEPELAIGAAAAALEVEDPFIGFITAVKLTNAVVARGIHAGIEAICIATVGVTNASRPGEALAEHFVPGTINLVVAVDAALSPGALNEALAIAVEAKALAVYEGGVRTANGAPATGTSTDAIAVACTGRGERQRYAGAVTPAGFAVATVVREAVGRGLGPALRRAREARR